MLQFLQHELENMVPNIDEYQYHKDLYLELR